eukprot:scaffold3852_cov129-Isochrysis_galbana.AAC.6
MGMDRSSASSSAHSMPTPTAPFSPAVPMAAAVRPPVPHPRCTTTDCRGSWNRKKKLVKP